MIKEIAISHFMAHTELVCTDIPPINIVIGRNDTGKTGLLKLLYATAKALEIYSLKKKSSEVSVSFKKELAEKIQDTFMPRQNRLGDLVQRGGKDKLEVNIVFDVPGNRGREKIYFSFGEKTESTITNCIELVDTLPEKGMNALFIPAKEVLTAFNDIRAIRESFYGRGFDDTYLDLIKALSLESTPGKISTELSSVNKDLAELFEGKIEQTGQQDQPFIFKKGNQQFAMHQTAEGIKKIGILTTLITNRQLKKGTILFMDEPETAFHPNAIRQLVEMLVAMSRGGVQIFLASHSYFVLKQLALCAKRENLSALCWSLDREFGQPVSNSFHDMIDGTLPDNSIIQESMEMYEEDVKLQLGL